MTKPPWARVEELYHAALERPAADRQAFLVEACGRDEALRSEIQSLLDHEQEADRMMEEPAAGVMTQPVAVVRGTHLGPYEVLSELGSGGMGRVYRARDSRLGRLVALKLLREDLVGPNPKERFVREARAASALTHPHIVTVYDIGEAEGHAFIAMEYVEGRTLDEIVRGGPLALERAIDIAIQIGDALATAHRQGIVHRDIKPSNILVTPTGTAKVVDFGLAKLLQTEVFDEGAPTRSDRGETEEGTVVGTAAYMSPEQAEGRPVDVRTDVFSFGSVLYEMLSGRRAFAGDSFVTTRMAVLRASPTPLAELGVVTPDDLQRILARCLEKDRDARPASAVPLLEDLQACATRLTSTRRLASLRRPRYAVPSALLVVALLAIGFGAVKRSSRVAWAQRTAMPEIERLIGLEQFDSAFRLIGEAEQVLPGDRELERLRRICGRTFPIESDPPGAQVFVKGYLAVDAPWIPLGRTPIKAALIPAGAVRWRIEGEGVPPLEKAGFTGSVEKWDFQLSKASPPEMVTVPGEGVDFLGNMVTVGDFLIDRHEVTNREFKRFVDRGGYTRRDLWPEPIKRDGKLIPWEEAMGLFKDATAQPGPAAWQFGGFPEGEEDYPVRGVSAYEAAAFAAFVGKVLPTVYHFTLAAHGSGMFSDQIAQLGNFGLGPAAVGSRRGLSPCGAYDMAGNVREWCRNATDTGSRYRLGGGFGDALYVFFGADAGPPLERD